MAKDTRSLLGGSHLRSLYALLLLQNSYPELLHVAEELEQFPLDTLKVAEFSIQPGNLFCRVFLPDSRNVGVRCKVPLLQDSHWDRLTELLSEKAFYTSQLLAGRLPTEVAELAKVNAIPLIPEEGIRLELDSVPTEQLTIEVAALFSRLSEALEEDPCQFLLFRGKTTAEVLAELRKKRLTQTAERRRPTAITELAYPVSPAETEGTADFWSMSPEVRELTYRIKADELPASILKWLAPIPLSGLEDRIDYVLEEGYARVARLAQSFGLGL